MFRVQALASRYTQVVMQEYRQRYGLQETRLALNYIGP